MENSLGIKYLLPELLLLVTAFYFILGFRHATKKSQTGVFISLLLAFSSLILMNLNFSHALFSENLIIDSFSQLFKKFIVGLGAIHLVLLTYHKTRQANPDREYYFFFLMFLIGAMTLVSANNFLIIFLALELTGFSSVLLQSYSKNQADVFAKINQSGLLGTVLLLMGMAFIYGLTGTLDLTKCGYFLGDAIFPQLTIAMIFDLIVVGLCLKLELFSYFGQSQNSALGERSDILSIRFINLISVFGVIIRLLLTVFNQPQFIVLHQATIQLIMILISGLILITGILLPIVRQDKQNLFFFVHLGFIVLGLTPLTATSLSTAILYAFTISITYIAVMLCLELEKSDIPSIYISKISFNRLLRIFFLLSLAGIPPTAGFAGRFALLNSILDLDKGRWWMFAVGITASAVLLWHYSHLILEKEDTMTLPQPGIRQISVYGLLIVILIINLFLGLFWHPVAEYIQNILTPLF